MENHIEMAVKLQSERYLKRSLKHMDYGTAGFRDKASELVHVMYRMGLLAVLRSKAKFGATIGIVITASHNPEEDNGIKLCDPLGDMLAVDWEIFAIDLANADNEELKATLMHIIQKNQIDFNVPASVHIGRDTRSSSLSLSNAAMDGIKALGGHVKDFGLLTTPQLHYVVCCTNDSNYGTPTEEGYYTKLSAAFEKLRSDKIKISTRYKPEVYVDCANGVGAHKLMMFAPYLPSLKMNLFNDGKTGILNYMCGADYVKIHQKPPEGTEILKELCYATFDGDADRLLYFYCDNQNTFHLLDGGKMAALMAKYLKQLVESTGLELEIRVVTTAYTNGSCNYYIENELKVPVLCVPTGTKNLHCEAKKSDIGVYFEANGHCSILFNDRTKSLVRELAANDDKFKGEKQVMAIQLLNVINLVNETAGDAISDMLLIETILCNMDWNIQDWDYQYCDLSCRQIKLTVPDRSIITTTPDARICLSPDGLQDVIDSLISKYEKGRAFVRPSGTEDIVRVYAEANNQANANLLAEEVAGAVKKFIA